MLHSQGLCNNNNNNNNNNSNNHVALQATEGQDLSTTAGLTSTCPQSEVKYHPTSLGMTCSQHVKTPAVFAFLS